MKKAELRKSLLAVRQAMAEELWREKSDRLCAHLQTLPQFIQADTVLAYFSTRQEPDLSPLLRSNKIWGFPRCVEKSLVWHVWSPQSALPLEMSTYGIQEPHPDAPLLESEQVDLLLVPAVACDRQGYRLGYGGGFYDRLLSQLEWKSKFAIGLVFDFAHLPHLPIDSWDKPLSAVCTESGLFFLSPGSGRDVAPL